MLCSFNSSTEIVECSHPLCLTVMGYWTDTSCGRWTQFLSYAKDNIIAIMI
ncbi:hypothetical protein L195_g038826, partial [Trifolium pratense]